MNSNTDRQIRAYREVTNYVVVPCSPEKNDWQVIKTDGCSYLVDLDANTCTCPDHARRGMICKHIHLAGFHASAEAPKEEKVPVKPSLSPEEKARIRRDIDALWP